jgi:hypothetical protein
MLSAMAEPRKSSDAGEGTMLVRVLMKPPSRLAVAAVLASTVVVAVPVGMALLWGERRSRTSLFIELSIVMVMAALAVGTFAMEFRERWPIWVAIPAVLLVGVGLELAFQGLDRGGSEAPAHIFATPAHLDHWNSFSTPQIAAAIARLTGSSQQAPPGTTVVARGYRRATGERVLFTGFDAKPGSTAAEEMSSPRDFVATMLDRAGVSDEIYPDPGTLGGTLACGDSLNAAPVTLCIWADKTSAAFVTFIGETPDSGYAARLSRGLLSGLLVRST